MFAKGVGFVASVYLARLLGSEHLGVYYTAIAIVGALSVLGTLGLGTATLRFTAQYAANKDWPHVFGVLKSSLVAVGVGSIVILSTVLFLAPWTSSTVFSNTEITTPLRWMALSILPSSLLAVIAGHLRGLNHITKAEIAQYVIAPLCTLPLLALLVDKQEVVAAAWVYNISILLALAAGIVIWLHSVFDRDKWHRKSAVSTKKLVRVGTPLLWLSGANLVISYSDIWILSIWYNEGEVGIYGVVLRLVALTNFIMVAVNNTVAARFADLFAKGRTDELASMFRMTTLLMVLLGLPIAGAFLIWPDLVLHVFGQDFVAGGVPLQILAAGEIVNLGAGSVGILLVMTGHERAIRNLGVFVAAVNLLLNLVLIPQFGATGAATATALAVTFKSIAAVRLVQKRLSIGLLP